MKLTLNFALNLTVKVRLDYCTCVDIRDSVRERTVLCGTPKTKYEKLTEHIP